MNFSKTSGLRLMSKSLDKLRRTLRSLIGLGLVVCGGWTCAWMIHTAPSPQVTTSAARSLEVATVLAQARTDHTPVIGHGTVRAKNQVNIIPEVSGRLTQVHPDLAQGKVIHKGDLLFEIDRTVYEARVRQANAEVEALQAAAEGHDQEQVNLEARLANAEEMLDIDRSDFETSKNLYQVEKVGTQRDLDLVHQKFLRQNDVIVELKSRLSMIPHLNQETRAQLEAARARLDQARHDLESTRILCPFEARVEAVQAYKTQVVTAHFSIATLTDMGAFEISVGIDPRELRWLDGAIRPGTEQPAVGGTEPEVNVSWAFQGQELTWRGHVSRFERVDEVTRTARLVVEIRDVDMVASVVSGPSNVRSTLSIGMFCKTDLPAAELSDALFVPRHAIYDNRWVYVVEPSSEQGDGRGGILARREVTMLRSVHDDVLVNYADRVGSEVCELKSGERVVISPLLKPVVGMKVRLRDDSFTEADRQFPLVNFQIPTVGPGTPSAGSILVDSHAAIPIRKFQFGNWQSTIGNSKLEPHSLATILPIGDR